METNEGRKLTPLINLLQKWNFRYLYDFPLATSRESHKFLNDRQISFVFILLTFLSFYSLSKGIQMVNFCYLKFSLWYCRYELPVLKSSWVLHILVSTSHPYLYCTQFTQDVLSKLTCFLLKV